MGVSTLVLLLVYRIANKELGIEQIGLWSIVATLTSFGNIGTFGISGSLVKFAAEFESKGERNSLIGLLNSFIIIMMILISGFLLLLYLFALLFLDQIVDIKYLDKAFDLIPFSFSIFFVSTIGYLILSVVEGLNKGWQRNLVVILSNIGLLITTILWIKQFGVKGIFLAQLVQALIILGSAILLLKINFKQYTWRRYTTDRNLLFKVSKYGFKFQSVSLFQMLGEPVTKFFLSRYGGLALVGIFEMASRIVVQVRTILATITSNLLPKLVDIHLQSSVEKVRNVFRQVFSINFYLFAFVMGGLLLFAGFIVKIWLGQVNDQLVNMIRIMTIGWFINGLAIVPYIFNLGSGQLNGNVYSHVMIGIINIIMGLTIVLGDAHELYFAYAWLLALIAGSIYTLLEFNKRHHQQMKQLISTEHVLSLLMIGVVFFTWNLIGKQMDAYYTEINLLAGILYCLLAYIFISRTEAYRWIREYWLSFSLYK